MRGWIFYLLFLLVFTSTVNALGIAPSDTYISFEPYGVGSFEIMLINNQEEAVNASISISGPFAKYFNIAGGVQEVISGSSTKYIVGYSFPASLSQHGPVNHDLNIIQKINKKQEGISASLNVVARVVVDVPYPERYLEYGLGVNNVNEGETLEFNFNIANKGEGNIFGFKPKLIIYDIISDEKIAELQGVSASLLSGSKVLTILKLDSSEIEGGTFIADSFVMYDGIETDHKNITFKVGYEDVEVIEYPMEIFSGGIRKLEFLLDNKWNENIDNVFIETYLEKNGVPVTERSISNGVDLKALESKTVPLYLDISNVNVGDYTLVVQIKYNGVEKTQKFDFSVKREGSFLNKEIITWFLIGLLVIANILWIVLRGGKHKEEKEEFKDKMDLLQDKLRK